MLFINWESKLLNVYVKRQDGGTKVDGLYKGCEMYKGRSDVQRLVGGTKVGERYKCWWNVRRPVKETKKREKRVQMSVKCTISSGRNTGDEIYKGWWDL